MLCVEREPLTQSFLESAIEISLFAFCLRIVKSIKTRTHNQVIHCNIFFIIEDLICFNNTTKIRLQISLSSVVATTTKIINCFTNRVKFTLASLFQVRFCKASGEENVVLGSALGYGVEVEFPQI